MNSLAAKRCDQVSVGTNVGRDSVLGIATRYPLDRPEIKSRWRRDIPPTVQMGSGAHLSFCTMDNGSLSRGKAVGVDHRTPPSAEVEESVELQLFSTSEPSWAVVELVRNLVAHGDAREGK